MRSALIHVLLIALGSGPLDDGANFCRQPDIIPSNFQQTSYIYNLQMIPYLIRYLNQGVRI